MGNTVAKNQSSLITNVTTSVVNKALMAVSTDVPQLNAVTLECCCLGDVEITQANNAKSFASGDLSSKFSTVVKTDIQQKSEATATAIKANLFPTPGDARAENIGKEVINAMTDISNITSGKCQTLVQQSNVATCDNSTIKGIVVQQNNLSDAATKCVVDAVASSSAMNTLSQSMKQSATAVDASGGAIIFILLAAVAIACVGALAVVGNQAIKATNSPVRLAGLGGAGLAVAYGLHKSIQGSHKGLLKYLAAMAWSIHKLPSFPKEAEDRRYARVAAQVERERATRLALGAGPCLNSGCGAYVCQAGVGCVVPTPPAPCPTGTSWRPGPNPPYAYGCYPL